MNCKHIESGELINISKTYINNFTLSGDEVNQTIIVTKEDKKDGTLGIRSIYENIPQYDIFTVGYLKQDTLKSKKLIDEELITQREYCIDLINKAKKDKKSMSEAYKIALEYIQKKNPITDTIKGENRTLRGYKVNTNSRDGKYQCKDVDINENEDKSNGIRLVNINTIKFIVYKGIEYLVK